MEYLCCTHTITIPPLQCSAPLRFHSAFDRIREEADSWALSRFNLSSQYKRNMLVQSQFPFLAATTYATGDVKRCVTVTKFIAWLFAFDDINDDMVNGIGSNICAAEELFQGLEDALAEVTPVAGGSQQQRQVVAVALDWWREMCEVMPTTQKARFLSVLRDSLDAWKAQISCRQAQTVPDVQSYILQRRKASALFIAFILLEYSMGMELDEEALSSDLLSQLQDAAIDHVSWVNDLLSLKSEYSRGEYNNIPSVVCFNQLPHDFQTSVETVARMIVERDNAFMRLLDQIKDSPLMEKPGVASYLDGLANWMSGNFYWSYVTARYHGVDADHTTLEVAAPLRVILAQKRPRLNNEDQAVLDMYGLATSSPKRAASQN